MVLLPSYMPIYARTFAFPDLLSRRWRGGVAFGFERGLPWFDCYSHLIYVYTMIDSPSTTFYPPNELDRLAAVRRYDILDTPPDGAFDRVAVIAARLFNVPIAIISIVDEDRIWFKSHHGLELEQIGRDPGLCASAILQNDVYSIIDATTDPRTLANPLVAGEFGLRFYAAAPLRTYDGFNLGTICVIDFQPRQSLSEVEKSTLQDLAAIVIDELELRLAARKTVELEVALRTQVVKNEQALQLAKTDALTGLKNRLAFEEDIELNVFHKSKIWVDTVVVFIELDGFKTLNDTLGHQQGDRLLKTFSRAVQSTFRSEDFTYRISGDGFAVLLPLKALSSPDSLQISIKRRMAEVIEQISAVGFEQVSARIGISTLSEANFSFQKAVWLADIRIDLEEK